MGLESGTYISDLVVTNPVGSSDDINQGDDHIRLLKTVLRNTFPNLTGAMTATQDALNGISLAATYSALAVDVTYVAADFGVVPPLTVFSASAIMTLPAASGVTAGKRRLVKSITTGSVVLTPAGSDTIDGVAASYRVPAYSTVEVTSNGSNGWVLTRVPETAVGTVKPFGQATLPGGWVACDGSAISRTTYAGLFAVLSTTWGVGDGATTFNVPDLRGRTAIGSGTGSGLTARTLAATGGAETHTLVIGEMPAHTHTGPNGAEIMLYPGGGNTPETGTTSGGDLPHEPATASTGGGGAHNNMQPFAVVTMGIKA